MAPQVLKILRSSFLAAILSLLVASGYALNLFHPCELAQAHSEVADDPAQPHEELPASGDDCQCLCHQAADSFARVISIHAGVAEGGAIDLRDEFPPDAVPLGIDLPPQIA